MSARMRNKVPEVTAYFWIIKVLCTTMGETAADYLNVNLNFGLTGTSIVTGVLLVIALFLQFRSRRYTPGLYWVTVVIISVFGTLVTDNLTDHLGMRLQVSTLIFSALLATTFAVWYSREKTLSIHSIFTRRREAFYWLAILFTFALGTASGDLMAEGLGLGYLVTGITVAVAIGVLAFAWRQGLNSILSFWLIYILTRPLGASLGDLLSQPRSHGGIGLGATLTSVIFLVAILALVIYLTVTKKDETTEEIVSRHEAQAPETGNAVRQTVITMFVLVALSVGGYFYQQSRLRVAAPAAMAPSSGTGAAGTGAAGAARPASPLGDLSKFRLITQDVLGLVNKGDLAGAATRVSDLEYEWDNAQARLKPLSGDQWTLIDGRIDTVLRSLRSTHPDAATCKSALQALLEVLQ